MSRRVACPRSPPESTPSMGTATRTKKRLMMNRTTANSKRVNPPVLVFFGRPIGDIGVFSFAPLLAVCAVGPQIEVPVVQPGAEVQVLPVPRIPGQHPLIQIPALAPLRRNPAQRGLFHQGSKT